jgi:signal transduction histidine kinase
VQIVVKDRGAGVPAAERERLFDRFYQSRAGASAGQGLGLGLNIVAGFARGMGGDVKVAARSGGGSVFTVELPGSKAPHGGKEEQRNG